LGWLTGSTASGGADEAEGAPLLSPALMARVRQIQIRTHRLVNTALAGGYRSTFRGQGVEFEEVRPYQPGDEVRAIDWNVTARTGEPFVKSYREERQLTLHLLVDTALPMDFATFGETKRDAAAQLAALIAFVAVRHQDRVGLTLFGAEPGLHLGPGRQSRHILRLVREIQSAPVTPGRSSLRSVLQDQESTLHRRAMVFVLSDFSSVDEHGLEGGSGEWVESLARLSRTHDVICVRLVDRLEEELPATGLLRLVRMEDGAVAEVDGRRESERAAWSDHATARREALGAAFRRARAEWIDVRTDGDLAAPLVRFFRRRAQARGPRRSAGGA
jgi:uncharacterized protein (DUF58 family)